MNVAEAIAEILRREGTEYLFCFPTTPIMDACAEIGIRPIVVRQERVAGNMADGYSRQSNGKRVGVVSVQQGAGAENSFSGITQAFTDSSAMLVIPGNWSIDYASLPPNFDTVKNFEHISKWADRITSKDGLLPRMRRAYTLLRNGRLRPVILELPLDVASQEISDFSYAPVVQYCSQADPSEVKKAVDMLIGAKHPLIWAGQGCLYAQASKELVELAELVGARVTTSLMGKSAIDESGPLAIGAASFSKNALVVKALAEADVIFAIGASLARDFTAAHIPTDDLDGNPKRFIHSNVEVSDVNLYFSSESVLIGDAKLVLRQMITYIREKGIQRSEQYVGALKESIALQKRAWRDSFEELISSDDEPINFFRVIGDFMKTFDPDETVVSHEPGVTRDVLVPHYIATKPRSYLGWGHSTQLGFSLGACLGAKLAVPEKMVVNFMGEAAIGMVMGDLETAVREKIPIITIIYHNSLMNNYSRIIPKAAKLFQNDELSGNYAAVAKALGAFAERIEKPAEIIPAFNRAIEAVKRGEPVLLDIICGNQPFISYGGEDLQSLRDMQQKGGYGS